MLISSKTFYKNHSYEIARYNDYSSGSLHLINTDSNYVLNNDKENIVRVKFNDFTVVEKYIENNEKFAFIVITDLFELSEDIYDFLLKIGQILEDDGKLLVTSINPKWNNILKLFELFKFKKNTRRRSYINPKKINNIARSAGLELISTNTRQVFPFHIYGLGTFINRLFELLFFYLNIGIKTYSLFRFINTKEKKYSKSIIVPAKNEEGNLEELINRIPNFKSDYEIIIICGESTDNTLGVSEEIKFKNSEKNIKVLKQDGRGKSNAVFQGISASNNELIAILDSDISVDPETLSHFFKIIEDGHADFVNGTRLIYGKEKNAMRLLNVGGNLLFQAMISIVIKQKLTDSLCGTKVFKRNYLYHLNNWASSTIIKDPFGDFDFIFSAAYSGQKILEYPVHYRSRKYGSTQISRFRDGWKLLIYFLNSLYKFNVSR